MERALRLLPVGLPRLRPRPVALPVIDEHAESVKFSGVAEQTVPRAPIKAQSTAVAQATASICNAEWGPWGGMSGHGGVFTGSQSAAAMPGPAHRSGKPTGRTAPPGRRAVHVAPPASIRAPFPPSPPGWVRARALLSCTGGRNMAGQMNPGVAAAPPLHQPEAGRPYRGRTPRIGAAGTTPARPPCQTWMRNFTDCNPGRGSMVR
jgi:hypothetical protein